MEFEISVSANFSKVNDFDRLKKILTDKNRQTAASHLSEYLSKQQTDISIEIFEYLDSILPFTSSAINKTTKKLNGHVVVGSWVEEACDEIYLLLKATNATNIRISARDDDEGEKIAWTPPKLENRISNVSIPQQVIPKAKKEIKKKDGKYLVQIYWDEDFDRLRYTIEVSIKNGQFDGLQIANMKSVNLFEVEFRDGTPHGKYTYIRNGKLLFECAYNQGRLHGDTYMKTEDDFVFANASFVEGYIDGSAQFFNRETGKKILGANYKMGVRHGSFEFESGNREVTLVFEEGKTEPGCSPELLRRLKGLENYLLFQQPKSFNDPEHLFEEVMDEYAVWQPQKHLDFRI